MMRRAAGKPSGGWLAIAGIAMLACHAAPALAQDAEAPVAPVATAEESADETPTLGDPTAERWWVYAGGYGGWSAMDVDSVVRDAGLARFQSIGIDRKGPQQVDGLTADLFVLDRVYDCEGGQQWSEEVRFFNFDGSFVLTKPLEKKPRPMTGSEAGHFFPIACGGEAPYGASTLNSLMKTGRDWHTAAAEAGD
ncbi:hypothetical protein [Paraurantiacibacter namhicola]|uniref:Uncharacterized protein n=1 Tax=Paraurantiacibacter namhicola TaxID=645517 RepID=A0A1C7DBL0_9SPHN|nr:hypothetical protein [Paraurantiacibacter namhicola]ANU08663.1 hypothetical protein A6F65_02380 [Paraurantiacibacter namhicola]